MQQLQIKFDHKMVAALIFMERPAFGKDFGEIKRTKATGGYLQTHIDIMMRGK